MKTFRLEVITPDRTVFDGEIAAATLPAEGGSLGVLRDHAPLVATLETGPIAITEADGTVHYLMVGDGFLEISRNHVRVLAEVGEREDQITLARAEQAEKRARERLKARNESGFDLARAQAALSRALVRQRILRDLAPHKRRH